MSEVQQKKEETPKSHLGDGLYAEFDGYQIALKANSHEHPTDTVYLEPAVVVRFLEFAQAVGVLPKEKE